MSIVAEDGTGVAGSETYATVAFADAYFGARTHLALYTTWNAATTAFKEGTLREATAYIDGTYGQHFRGQRKGRVQGLEWPRLNALDDAGYELPGLPAELQKATCELAARALSAVLASDVTFEDAISELKAGSVMIKFADPKTNEAIYGVVSKMLAPILDGTQPGSVKATWHWR